ncbi:hypothetical protein ACT44U_03750 [Acinetobacter baumannii]
MERHFVNTFLFLVFCFYLYIAAFSYTSIIVENSEYSSLITIIRVGLIFLMVLVKICENNFKRIDVIFLMISGILLATLNPFFSIVSFMLIVGFIVGNFVNDVKAINFANYISMISLITILLLCNLGILENRVFYDTNDYAKSIRYSLGFDNPNATSMFIVQTIMIFFVYKNNLGKILSLFLGGIVAYYAASRTAFLILVCFFLMFLFLKSNKIIKLIKWISISFLLFVPLFLKLFIANNIWVIGGYDLDQLLSGRLSLIQEFYRINGGLSIFPSYDDFPLDSGLANIILKGGMGFYCLFIFVCYLYLKKETNRYFIYLFISFLMLLISENFITGNMLLSVLLVARFIFLLRQINLKYIGVVE